MEKSTVFLLFCAYASFSSLPHWAMSFSTGGTARMEISSWSENISTLSLSSRTGKMICPMSYSRFSEQLTWVCIFFVVLSVCFMVCDCLVLNTVVLTVDGRNYVVQQFHRRAFISWTTSKNVVACLCGWASSLIDSYTLQPVVHWPSGNLRLSIDRSPSG